MRMLAFWFLRVWGKSFRGDRVQLEFSVHSSRILTDYYWHDHTPGGLSLEPDGEFGPSTDFRGATHRGWTCLQLLAGPEPEKMVTEASWAQLEALFRCASRPADVTLCHVMS
eukprot:3762067-Rhodomonas_salina.1